MLNAVQEKRHKTKGVLSCAYTAVSTLSIKIRATFVTPSLSRGLVWLLPKFHNFQSLPEESARAEILRLRFAESIPSASSGQACQGLRMT